LSWHVNWAPFYLSPATISCYPYGL
jgi:hypothetical protein